MPISEGYYHGAEAFSPGSATGFASGAKPLDHAAGPLALSPPMASGTHTSILPLIRGRWRHATD